MTFLPESPLWLIIADMVFLIVLILVFIIDHIDLSTFEYYKDKDLLMRKPTLKENFYRLLTNLKGK